MSEVKIQNKNNQTLTQVQPAQSTYTPSYVCMPVVPNINNTNNYGYLPTYQSPYYTQNYGYQIPQIYNQYPVTQTLQQSSQSITNPINQSQPIAQKQNGSQVIQPVIQNGYIPNGQQQITPGATIDAGGTKCEIPPGTNGLNIIINSPTVAAPGSNPMINTNTNCLGNGQGGASASSAAASANADSNKPKKTKKIVALTDDYIKNLENYLRSPNKELKSYAIKEISKRFEEDDARKTNPSLNALLNLALQAKEPHIRFIALSLLNSGLAGGNDVTIQILNNMQQSGVYKGEEANDVKKALLKMSETVVKVPDNSPDKPVPSKKEGE